MSQNEPENVPPPPEPDEGQDPEAGGYRPEKDKHPDDEEGT
jgi:hypothetical protein